MSDLRDAFAALLAAIPGREAAAWDEGYLACHAETLVSAPRTLTNPYRTEGDPR